MSDLHYSDGPGGPFHRIAKVSEWTLFFKGRSGHYAVHNDGTTRALGHDPEIKALAEAIARQRCKDQAPQEPQP